MFIKIMVIDLHLKAVFSYRQYAFVNGKNHLVTGNLFYCNFI